jgi:DeoR/GlpR family transcriptional regulator of sugar metabolism
MRAQAVRDMSASAEQVVVLTESEKFQSAGTVPLNLSRCQVSVITDADIAEDVKNTLQAHNIAVTTI